jgi:hypothetical protein
VVKGNWKEGFRKEGNQPADRGLDRPAGGLSEKARNQPTNFDEVRDNNPKERLPVSRDLDKGD